MAHFAKLDENNMVLEVHVVDNDHLLNADGIEQEAIGVQFLVNWSNGHTNWKQTSYNGNFRKNYAGPGFLYDENLDAFIPPKPFNSWVLNENSCKWDAPTPYPDDGNSYTWDENTTAWQAVETI